MQARAMTSCSVKRPLSCYAGSTDEVEYCVYEKRFNKPLFILAVSYPAFNSCPYIDAAKHFLLIICVVIGWRVLMMAPPRMLSVAFLDENVASVAIADQDSTWMA
ncbi:hypothetical protein Droror1_Dr00009613 [Drosera rotundifolia]